MRAQLAEGQAADTQTPVNLCNHTYWNLSGDFEHKTVHEHLLSAPLCSRLVQLGEGLIPTGVLQPVQEAGSGFDFTGGFSKLSDRGRLSGAIDGGG